MRISTKLGDNKKINITCLYIIWCFALEITRPSTITLVKGEPGVGKTTLVIKSLSNVKKCYYVSYNETADSLSKKMERLNVNSNNIKLVRGLSGSGQALNRQVSEILSQMQDGAVVVIDSIDAMLEGVNDEPGRRALLQVIYSSAKQHNASLVFVTEGSSKLSKRLGYISDLILNVGFEIREEKIVRYISIEKDRDRRVERQRYNFTLEGNAEIFDGSIDLKNEREISGYAPVEFPNEIKIGDGDDFLGRYSLSWIIALLKSSITI